LHHHQSNKIPDAHNQQLTLLIKKNHENNFNAPCTSANTRMFQRTGTNYSLRISSGACHTTG
jgi:hypothetical protein